MSYLKTLAPMCLRTMRARAILFFLTFSASVYGQADCVIRFTYTWTTDSIKDKEIELGLPTTDFLGGYSTKAENDSFYFVKLTNQEATLTSHMSSEFCGDHQQTIDKFFKGNKSFYLLKLRTVEKEKEQTEEIEIPIDSITFSFDKTRKQIIIQLLNIKR